MYEGSRRKLLGIMAVGALLCMSAEVAVAEEINATQAEAQHAEQVLHSIIPNQGKHLVAVTAPWCPACQHFKPHLEALKKAGGIQVHELDSGSPEAEKLGIHSIPTILLMENGRFVKMRTGGMSLEDLKVWAGA